MIQAPHLAPPSSHRDTPVLTPARAQQSTSSKELELEQQFRALAMAATAHEHTTHPTASFEAVPRPRSAASKTPDRMPLSPVSPARNQAQSVGPPPPRQAQSVRTQPRLALGEGERGAHAPSAESTARFGFLRDEAGGAAPLPGGCAHASAGLAASRMDGRVRDRNDTIRPHQQPQQQELSRDGPP